MKAPTSKLRPAVTAALTLSMMMPAPLVQAAELDAAQASDADLKEDAVDTHVAPEPPADAPPASNANTLAETPDVDETPAAETAEPEAVDVSGVSADDTGTAPTSDKETSSQSGSAMEHAPAQLAEGDVAINESSFPDPIFRAWVLNAANLDGIGADGILTKEEREAVTGILAKRLGIRDITGIELFPNLTFIDFEGNHIERVDLSGNPKLLSVYLRNNCLTAIDFTHNTQLKFIEVFDNRLTEIDLSMLPDLEFVHLDYNDLKVIDLSHNTKLARDGFVGNNNPLEKVILPRIEGRSFDSFVISELDEYEGYTSTLPEWYTTPDFQAGTGITPSTTSDCLFIPFDGQTLYVKRTPNTYTVRFDAAGGDGTMNEVTRTWNDGSQALPTAAFRKLGYRFAGWAKTSGGAVAYTNGQEVENIAGADDTGETLTLYAVWEPIAASNGYFRSQLTANEQLLYDDIASQLDELTDPHDPSSLEAYAPQGLDRSLGRVLFAVLRDHPEYFWIDFSRLSWEQVQGDVYALAPRVTGESYFVDGFTAENLADYRARFTAQVDEIVAAAPKDTVLAVRYFNEWLSANNVYNASGLGASNFSRTAASGILSANDAASGPVCYGYATAMKVLLDRAGIENAYVEGWAYNGKNGSGEQHAWNYVRVGDAWYAVDPTWNDPASVSSPALETYLLVGSSTRTTPSLVGKETFGTNHDPSRSPALDYDLAYPTLSTYACQGVSADLVEVSGPEGSQRFATISDALAAAGEGQTIRLWSDIKLDAPVKVTQDINIDLNGYGLSYSGGSALQVEAGSTLKLSNSLDRQVTVSSETGAAVSNQGELILDPWICLKGDGMGAVSGTAPQAGEHTYLARTTTSYIAYKVEEPASPDRGDIDVSDAGKTLGDLVAYVNGEGKPELPIFYLNAPGSAIKVPSNAVPSYSWELVARAGTSEELVRGTYQFKTTVFGYELTYTIEVNDAVRDQAVADGTTKVNTAIAELEAKARAGLVTVYDLELARADVAALRAELNGAVSAEVVEGMVSSIINRLDATPTVMQRADELEAAWNDDYASVRDLMFEGAVSFDSAIDCLTAAQTAIDAADTQHLAAQLPQGMSAADRALVASVARVQIEASTGNLLDLNNLAAAARWSQTAMNMLKQLPSPVTGDNVDELEGLIAELRGLSDDARRLLASSDVSRVEELLEEALKASADNDTEQPGTEEKPEGNMDETEDGSGDVNGSDDTDQKPSHPSAPDEPNSGENNDTVDGNGAEDSVEQVEDATNQPMRPVGNASAGRELPSLASALVLQTEQQAPNQAAVFNAQEDEAATENTPAEEVDAASVSRDDAQEAVAEQHQDENGYWGFVGAGLVAAAAFVAGGIGLKMRRKR